MNKIFAAILYSSEDIAAKAATELKNHFGDIDLETEPFRFDRFTNYYEKEMGKDLKKKFVFFKEKSDMNIAALKLITKEIEKKFSAEGKRKANIDPGYMNENEMGLPSTKPLQSRKLIRDSIYNQVIYTFENNELKAAERAFPDYRSEEVKQIFAKVFISLRNNPKQ